jgi:hypothetical protein
MCYDGDDPSIHRHRGPDKRPLHAASATISWCAIYRSINYKNLCFRSLNLSSSVSWVHITHVSTNNLRGVLTLTLTMGWSNCHPYPLSLLTFLVLSRPAPNNQTIYMADASSLSTTAKDWGQWKVAAKWWAATCLDDMWALKDWWPCNTLIYGINICSS